MRAVQRTSTATISVHLVVSDPELAARWYGDVFGAIEISRVAFPDGGVFAIGLLIGDTEVHLAGEYPAQGIISPLTLGGTYLALQVRADDVDTRFQRALQAGAMQFHPLADTAWGDRAGQFIDPFGHRWGLYRHDRDVSSEEVGRQVAKMFGGDS